MTLSSALLATPRFWPLVLGTGAGWLFLATWTAVYSYRSYRICVQTLAIEELAAGGHRQRARIMARSEGSALRDLLSALSGETETEPPSEPGLVVLLPYLAVPAALAAVALVERSPETSLIAILALLATLPLAASGLWIAYVSGAGGRRRQRAALLPLLVENVRVELGRERPAPTPPPSTSREERRPGG